MNTKVRKDLAQNLTQVSIRIFSFLLPVGRRREKQQNKTKQKTLCGQRQKIRKPRRLGLLYKICLSVIYQVLPSQGKEWSDVHSYKAFLENTIFISCADIDEWI